jgi:hypothetical protein
LPTPFDSWRESKAYESRNHESSFREPSRPPRDPFGVGIRMAAAVGVAALIALLFVILTPGLRRTDTASSFSADVLQFTTALPPRSQGLPSQDQQSQDQQSPEEAAKPAIAQFQRLLALPNEPAGQADPVPSDKLLQPFVQWRLKGSSAGNTQ